MYIRLFFVLLTAICVNLFACTPSTPPTLAVTLDAKSYAAGGTIKLTVNATNFSISQDNLGKTNQTGQGHYRVYLDNATGDDFLKETGIASTDIKLPDTITAGSHILSVVLYNNDRTALTPAVKETVTFEVTQDATPTVSLTVDKEKATIGELLKVSVSVQNFKLLSIGTEPVNKPNEGHFHLVWDDGNPEKDYFAASDKSNVIVNVPDTLGTGKHTLSVYLMNHNHSLIKPEIKASVEIEISGGTKPTLDVKSDKTEVEPDGVVSLTINVTNFTLISPDKGAANAPNEGHYRVTLDNQNPSTEFLLKSDKSRVEVAMTNVTSGNHTLVVTLVNNDGSPFDPSIQTSIPIFVKGGTKPEVTASIDKTTGKPGDVLTLDITTKDFLLKEIVNGAKNTPGEGHYHIVFDDKDPEQEYAEAGFTKEFKLKLPTDLKPGQHKLWIYLMNNDHSLYVPNTRFGIDITIE
jgi:hypothetical protein